MCSFSCSFGASSFLGRTAQRHGLGMKLARLTESIQLDQDFLRIGDCVRFPGTLAASGRVDSNPHEWDRPELRTNPSVARYARA
jgi:hypothetical protein